MGIKDVARLHRLGLHLGHDRAQLRAPRAWRLGDQLSHSSIRFGLGRFNTEEEVDYVADRVVETVMRLRELLPLFESAKPRALC